MLMDIDPLLNQVSLARLTTSCPGLPGSTAYTSRLLHLRIPPTNSSITMAGHGFHYSAKAGPVAFPKVGGAQRFITKALGATMWFWIMYRLREEGPILFGLRKPWEGHH